jgi:hypothetical protein
MATTIEIINVLKLLSGYYGRELSASNLQVYLQALADLEPRSLAQAARQWIGQSPFFPRVSELRQLAARISGSGNTQAPLPDYLAAEALELEESFADSGVLDPRAWNDLARRFEQADRPHRAAAIRRRLAAYQQLLLQT